MFGPDPEDRFWYITLYNENYPMPALPEGAEGDDVRWGVLRGSTGIPGSGPTEGRAATHLLLRDRCGSAR